MVRIVLGLGTGQCGLNLLAEILNQQVDAAVTLEERPLLPWNPQPNWPGLRERIARWKANRNASLVGDVASFYLPHIEPVLQSDASIKAVCLTRPRDEVVAGFIQQIDRICPFPTNHWAKVPAPGWFHAPLWSQCFPQYETTDRETGIAQYWDDYESVSRRLAELYPQQFLRLDAEALTHRDGVRRLLDFLEIPTAAQVVVTGRKPAPKTNEPISSPKPRFPNPTDPRRCVVLVPFSGFIHQDCENSLKELERRGYQVRRVAGYAAIDQGRNQMATDALLDGFDETLWIDSDVGFHPDDVDRLRAHHLPIVCGIYPQKGKRALACHVMPGAQQMTFGEQGGLTELLYAGTGFLLIRREVYLAVQRHHQLPTCNERFGHPMLPFFYPMLRPIDDGHWYLAEDYAFCERARQAGYQIWADTTIRLWHIGTYRYGWEDAGMDRPRFETFTLNFGPPENETPNRRLSPDALANFVRAYPWPAEKPEVPQPPHRNWFYPRCKRLWRRRCRKTRNWSLRSVPGWGDQPAF